MSSRFCGLFDYQTALGNQIPILLIFEKLHVATLVTNIFVFSCKNCGRELVPC